MTNISTTANAKREAPRKSAKRNLLKVYILHSLKCTPKKIGVQFMKARAVRRGLLIFGLFALATASTQAKTYSVLADVVGTYTSTSAETKLQFVERVAGVLQTFSAATGTEACGALEQRADGSYSVTLTTEHSQIMCISSSTPSAGGRLIGETIHNHPSARQIILTEADSVALNSGDPDFSCKRKGCHVRAEPDGFSSDDFAQGAGYLVTENRLLFQNGVGTTTIVEAQVHSDAETYVAAR